MYTTLIYKSIHLPGNLVACRRHQRFAQSSTCFCFTFLHCVYRSRFCTDFYLFLFNFSRAVLCANRSLCVSFRFTFFLCHAFSSITLSFICSVGRLLVLSYDSLQRFTCFVPLRKKKFHYTEIVVKITHFLFHFPLSYVISFKLYCSSVRFYLTAYQPVLCRWFRSVLTLQLEGLT